MQTENITYVKLLVDSLQRKEKLLKKLLAETKKQEELLKADKMDATAFEQVISEKGLLIQELEELDNGFNAIFRRVKQAMKQNPTDYKSEGKEMQVLIQSITEISMQVQVLEKQNESRFQMYLASEKQNIRAAKRSSNVTANYHKSLNEAYMPDQSYFFNKKK